MENKLNGLNSVLLTKNCLSELKEIESDNWVTETRPSEILHCPLRDNKRGWSWFKMRQIF